MSWTPRIPVVRLRARRSRMVQWSVVGQWAIGAVLAAAIIAGALGFAHAMAAP